MSDNAHGLTSARSVAIEHARAWFNNIRKMVAAVQTLSEREEYGISGELDDLEAAEQAIIDSVLSVQVRSGWHLPSAHSIPAEYEILLTTTGASDLRIIGYLDGYCEPENAVLQWQKWDTPWTDATPSLDLGELFTPSDIDAILLSFARHFYFGG